MKVIIIGIGKLGFKIATYLALEENAQITVVDKNQAALDRITNIADVMTVKANATHIEALKDLGVDEYTLAITATGDDETNIISSIILKKTGCKKVVARIRNPEYVHHQDFIKNMMDIDLILNPELSTAKSISNYLSKSYSFITNNFAQSKISLFDIPAQSVNEFVGKKIMDIPQAIDFVIVAILRNDEIIIPNGNHIIEQNDILYIMGETTTLNKFVKQFKASFANPVVKNVVIVGGGRVGYYLARRLADKGIGVKIIERNEQTCEFIAENLKKNVLVLNGNGSDFTLLEEEDIAKADAFVSATGYDEENLLLALSVKKMGVKKCIAKVSRSTYVNVIEQLGVDATFSTVDISSSDIMKFFRGGKVDTVSLLLGGKAEVDQLIADKSMEVVGVPLYKVTMPKGVIIGAILTKNRDVIVPKGSTVINPGDRFVVFSIGSALQKAGKLFK